MNFVAPHPSAGRQHPRSASFGHAHAGATSLKWATLGEAANVVASLAGLEPEHATASIRNYPALLRDADPWRREQAENGIADLSAVMESGLAALLAVHARGADPGPAATALWREFVAARSALLRLLPPNGTMGPRRSA